MFRPSLVSLGSSLFLLVLCRLALAQNPDFAFPPGGIKAPNLKLNPGATVSSSGDLVLDGSSSFAEALYGSPFSLVDLSFNTYFTISANTTSANGSFAFVIVADSSFDITYETQRNAFALVFNNTCFGQNYTGSNGGWRGGRFGRGGGRGFLGPSMMRASVYAGGQLLTPSALSAPYPWQNGPGWNPSEQTWPTSSCTPQPDDAATYDYEVAVQYNASAKEVTLALGSGCFVAGQVVYSQDLSTILSQSAYVGFTASEGAIYTLTQWNFTSNATSSILSSIATTIASSSSGTPGGSGGSGGSGSKLKKGYVVGFSLLGGGIGVATLVGACFLYRKRKMRSVTKVHGAEAAKFPSMPIKGMMNTKTKTVSEYDTSPLYPVQSRTSSADNASWLKPVDPR